MKKILLILGGLLATALLGACSTQKTTAADPAAVPSTTSATDTGISEKGGNKMLIAYFSNTGNTQQVAEKLAETVKADLYRITPETPYSDLDLDYQNEHSRSSVEQNDPDSRPALADHPDNLTAYDTVFLAYPIWWGVAPKIMNTFLETGDWSGKRIIPLCTSGGSGIGSSAEKLAKLTPKDTKWLPGRDFSASVSQETLAQWVAELELPPSNSESRSEAIFDLSQGENGRAPLVTLNSGYQMPVAGIGTYSLTDQECEEALLAAFASGVRLVDTAYMYHNEEAVGRAVRKSGIPREELFITTKLYPSQFSDAAAAIDDALARLDLEYVDLMLLHHPGANDVAAYHALEAAAAAGKIRSIGLSNWYVEELTEFLPQVTVTPALVQNEIHPYYQDNDVIPFIQEKGIVVEGWYPLGGRGHTKELLTNQIITEIAAAHKKSAAQVILRWNLQKGVVVIPGSSNPVHIAENIALFDFELSPAEMAAINGLDRNEKHDWY